MLNLVFVSSICQWAAGYKETKSYLPFPSAFVPHITVEGRVMLGPHETESIVFWRLGYC